MEKNENGERKTGGKLHKKRGGVDRNAQYISLPIKKLENESESVILKY